MKTWHEASTSGYCSQELKRNSKVVYWQTTITVKLHLQESFVKRDQSRYMEMTHPAPSPQVRLGLQSGFGSGLFPFRFVGWVGGDLPDKPELI